MKVLFFVFVATLMAGSASAAPVSKMYYCLPVDGNEAERYEQTCTVDDKTNLQSEDCKCEEGFFLFDPFFNDSPKAPVPPRSASPA